MPSGSGWPAAGGASPAAAWGRPAWRRSPPACGGWGASPWTSATAGRRVTCGRVAARSRETVAGALEAWARQQTPAGIELAVHRDAATGPALTPPDPPAVAALARSITRVWGAEPLFTRSGGSGPEEALGRVLAPPLPPPRLRVKSPPTHPPHPGPHPRHVRPRLPPPPPPS